MFPVEQPFQADSGGGGNRTRVVSLPEPRNHADRWLRMLESELRELLAENGPRSRPSNVYAIGVEAKYVKIGVADKPKSRLREIQVGNPDELALLGQLSGPVGWEPFIHEMLAGSRIRSEWFRWSEDIDALLELFARESKGVMAPQGPSHESVPQAGGVTERQGAGLLTRGSCNSDAGSIPAPSAVEANVAEWLKAPAACGRGGLRPPSVGSNPTVRPDEIWEHKKGKIWRLVERLTQENRALRYQVRILQARVQRSGEAVVPGSSGRKLEAFGVGNEPVSTSSDSFLLVLARVTRGAA